MGLNGSDVSHLSLWHTDRGSHVGNSSFPRWDYDVPTLGLKHSHAGNNSKYKQTAEYCLYK